MSQSSSISIPFFNQKGHRSLKNYLNQTSIRLSWCKQDLFIYEKNKWSKKSVAVSHCYTINTLCLSKTAQSCKYFSTQTAPAAVICCAAFVVCMQQSILVVWNVVLLSLSFLGVLIPSDSTSFMQRQYHLPVLFHNICLFPLCFLLNWNY